MLDELRTQCVVIGGDGTHRAIDKLYAESRKRKACVAICGITKSIDQDVPLIDRCFGFDTAVEEAQRSIRCAKTEALSAENGIGLVQLMGRHSGQIALFASLASREVDCCLIPEVKFKLEGRRGLFEYIRETLSEKGHMVIVVAEGAGIDLVESGDLGKDKSGNARLPYVRAGVVAVSCLFGLLARTGFPLLGCANTSSSSCCNLIFADLSGSS